MVKKRLIFFHGVLKHKQKDAVQLCGVICDAAGWTDLHFQRRRCCRVVVELPGLDVPGMDGLAPLHSPAEGKST